MLLEGSAWRGLDNLFIPIGGFYLLQAYLPLGVDELVRRLLVTAALVLAVLAFRRSSSMLDDSLLAGAFLCYVTWAYMGWRWIVPPAIGFIGYVMTSRDEPEHGQRFHTLLAMAAIWAAALAWLIIARATRRGDLLFPFTLVFASHVAMFGLSRTAHQLRALPLRTLAILAVLEAWATLFLPYVAFEGVTSRNLWLAVLAIPAIAAAVWGFMRVEPEIRNLPQTLPRWWRQTASAAAGSIVGWVLMSVFDRIAA
jgi:phytol kinase